MPPHENHRTVVTVLAGVIAVLASTAGTSVFVVGSLTADPSPSVPVAPIVRLAPAAPAVPALKAPVPAEAVVASPAPAVRPPLASAPIPSLVAPLAKAAHPSTSAEAIPARPTTPARPIAPTLTASVTTVRTASVTTVRTAAAPPPPSPVTSGLPLTVASVPVPALAVVRVVVEPPAAVVSDLSGLSRTATVIHPSAVEPEVSGWRVAKLAGPRDLDLAVPAPVLRHVAFAVAELATRPRYQGVPAGADEAVGPLRSRPATTLAPVAPRPPSPAPTAFGDGQPVVQGDGLNGPSTHH